ncbi:MAG: sugar phosphate isomerase/epimerase [Alicyclobacillus sp.]|nr:sugar phosphate isomerase/epimerase [Alicyclobacillus sp.]
MRLGVQVRNNFGPDVVSRLRVVQEAGADCVEVDGRDLLESCSEVRSFCRRTGLSVSTACGGYRGWIGHFEEELRRQAVTDLRAILERCAEVGAAGVVVPAAYGMFSTRLNAKRAPRPPEEDRKVLLEALFDLDRQAERTGTWVFLEPLNRYEDHMLNTVAEAVALIQAGRFTRVRVTADSFHMNIEEPSMEGTLHRFAPWIGHVHVADSNRFQPGRGHLDFKSFFLALCQAGYGGAVVAECSWSGDLSVSVREAVAFMRQQLEAAYAEDKASKPAPGILKGGGIG